MPPRAPNISPLQVLYQAFPDAVRFVAGQITRVRSVNSTRGDRDDPLSVLVRRAIAPRILAELQRRFAHESTRAQRRADRRADEGAAAGVAVGDGAVPAADIPVDEGVPNGFGALEELAMADEAPSQAPAPGRPVQLLPPGMPRERDISLIEIDEDATVRTRVFPRSVHCQRCGHFELLDPNNVPATLQCPCCKAGTLRVEPIVFVCGRCADIRELVPPLELRGDWRRPGVAERALGAPTVCPDCHRGHIHLEKHGTNRVAQWEWRCTSNCGYREVLQERCLKCAVPAGVQGAAPASVIFMNAIPASAPNALQSLVHQDMFVDGGTVDPQSLLAAADRAIHQGWRDAFMVATTEPNETMSHGELATLREACIGRAFLVNNVWAVTVAYGYVAGPAASHPQTPVSPDEKLAHLFHDPEGFTAYRAYSHSTQGNALVLCFDAVRVVARLDELAPGIAALGTLEQILAVEGQEISERSIRELLRAEGGSLLAYRSLHALEHALLNAAMRQLGTDSLGARLFASTSTVVIFEKARVGRGGVIQLVNRGEGLLRLIEAARDLTLGCAQGCVDGCPTCAYMVRDQFCTHPLDEIGVVWLPANSLLSRRGAAAILSSEGSH